MELDHPQNIFAIILKFKIAESFINNIQFGNKTIQRLNLLNSIVWGFIFPHFISYCTANPLAVLAK
jgi:hypothetical protein